MNIIEKSIVNIAIKLLYTIKFDYIIEQIQKKRHLEENLNCCIIDKLGCLHSQAKIVNLKCQKDRIIIGKYSHIRGELLVNNYGGKINIGDYCYVGENTRIWSGNSINIGNNVLIAHNVNILDTNAHPINPIERKEDFKNIITSGHPKEKNNIKTAPINIENNVWIGLNSSILKGVNIGKGAIVGAGTVVTNDIPPWAIVVGSPFRIIAEIPICERTE